jgi:CRISPR/Cas system-associated exonuclease Cas4 (RecB family)
MNSFSPNMLKTFETCPQKYYFKYIEKISVPQKSNLFEKGKKVHALANYYLRGDDISKMEKALNSEELKLWESLKQNEFFNKTYVNSEYNLSCKVGNYWIGGRLDALMKDEKNYYILDYKTGSIPKNPEYDYQTITYLLCTSKMYGNNIKFIYIDLQNNQNSIIDFNSAKAQEYEKRIIDICNKITNTQFPEEIEHSKICDFCEYKKICI